MTIKDYAVTTLSNHQVSIQEKEKDIFHRPILRKFLVWMVGLVTLFAGITYVATQNREVDALGGGVILQLAAFLPLVWFAWHHLEGKIKLGFLFNRKIAPLTSVQLSALIILILVMSTGLDVLTLRLLTIWTPEYVEDALTEQIMVPEGGMVINGLTILLAVFIGPLMEELVFRGLLLQRFISKFGTANAILGSSLLFGMLHFESFIAATIFGIFMCLLFLKTNNLWIPLIVHWTNNALAVILDYWLHHAGSPSVEELYRHSWFAWTLLITLPACFYLIWQHWVPRGEAYIPYHLNQSAEEGVSNMSGDPAEAG